MYYQTIINSHKINPVYKKIEKIFYVLELFYADIKSKGFLGLADKRLGNVFYVCK